MLEADWFVSHSVQNHKEPEEKDTAAPKKQREKTDNQVFQTVLAYK